MSEMRQRVMDGHGTFWHFLEEEDKYAVWSNYVTSGGIACDYFVFCDTMDMLADKFSATN